MTELSEDERGALIIAALSPHKEALFLAVEVIIEERLDYAARVLCETHQSGSPTRQPCAACAEAVAQ